MEKKIKNVAVYVRKSREEETEDTINRQQAVLIDLCEKNSWSWELYKEVGSSQDLEERVELQKMLEKIQLFHFDAVVVADIDRLSRNVIHFGQIKLLLVNSGVLVVTPTKVFDFTNDSDDMFSDFMSVIAKSEYQQIKKRLVRGTRQSAKQGNYLGKKAPIGYKYNKNSKRLEKSEDAPIIRRLFELYMCGLSTKDIACQFDFEAVFTSVGMRWNPAGVSRLLNNPVYVGHSIYGRTKQYKKDGKRVTEKTSDEQQIIVENTHDGIVNLEEWMIVQGILKKRNSRPPSLKLGKHPFSGLIVCSLCGGVHSFQSSRGNKKRISSCQTRHYSKNMTEYSICKNRGVNLSEFESMFYLEFGKYADRLDEYITLIKEADKGEISNYDSEIESKRKQIQKIEQNIKRIQAGFISGVFDEKEAGKEIKQFKAQIASLESQIDNIEKQDKTDAVDFVEMTLKKLKRFLTGKDQLQGAEANDILRDFVKTIYYKRLDKEIEMNIVWKDLD